MRQGSSPGQNSEPCAAILELAATLDELLIATLEELTGAVLDV